MTADAFNVAGPRWTGYIEGPFRINMPATAACVSDGFIWQSVSDQVPTVTSLVVAAKYRLSNSSRRSALCIGVGVPPDRSELEPPHQ